MAGPRPPRAAGVVGLVLPTQSNAVSLTRLQTLWSNADRLHCTLIEAQRHLEGEEHDAVQDAASKLDGAKRDIDRAIRLHPKPWERG